jgi:hypothetical protein
MLRVTAEEFDIALDRAEEDLIELAQMLDRPIRDELFFRALQALGLRARALFRGFSLLAKSDTPAAAFSLLRPMIEVNLTLRFLVAKPDLHAELWAAEGERQSLVLVREFAEDAELAEKHTTDIDLDAEWVKEREEYVEETRDQAIRAGIVGISPKKGKALMPSMRTMAINHGDLATREAYTLAYRSLSHDVHGSSRAFSGGHFAACEGGTVRFIELSEPEREVRRHRALSSTTLASILCILSGPLELDVFEDASFIKQVLLTTTVEDDDESDGEPRQDAG